MKWAKCTQEQVGYAFRQAESGTPIGNLLQQFDRANPSKMPSLNH